MEDFVCNDCKRGQEGGSNEELYCICRTPYDESQYGSLYFLYLSINIRHIMSSFSLTYETLTVAFTTMSLILSRRFYIGCDRCQNWYHGRCVGILQSEANHIDVYVCPQCQSTEDAMTVLTPLTDKDYEGLKRILRSLQVFIYLSKSDYLYLYHNVNNITLIWSLPVQS